MEKFSIKDLNVSLITPGGKGNPVDKMEGDLFGASISFKHKGKGLTLDVGWAVHCGETYVWAYNLGMGVSEHLTETLVTIQCSGKWGTPASIGIGASLSAQAVITEAGKLSGRADFADEIGIPIRPIWTAKLASNMSELPAILERTYADVYKKVKDNIFTDIEAGAS